MTREWWENRRFDYQIFISDLVRDEAGEGYPEAAAKRLQAIGEFALIPVGPRETELANVYVREGLIPGSAGADAIHVALAVLSGMDYLLTWNCRHIASGSLRSGLSALNLRLGLQTPTICTPEELL